MKTLNIFHIADIGFYAVSSEFEGAGFPIPEDIFYKMQDMDDERGSHAAIALFVQLRTMESLPLDLLAWAGESSLAMSLGFEMASEVDQEIAKFLASEPDVKDEAIVPGATTLKVYVLNKDDEALVVTSDEPDVGVLIPLDFLRIIGKEELSSESGQQAFIATVESAKREFMQENTAHYVLDEDDVIYSITYMAMPVTVH